MALSDTVLDDILMKLDQGSDYLQAEAAGAIRQLRAEKDALNMAFSVREEHHHKFKMMASARIDEIWERLRDLEKNHPSRPQTSS